MHLDRSGRNSLEKLFTDLNSQTCSYNNVRFPSYRIALKVKSLITKFKLTYVDYKIVLFQLNQEGIAFGRQFSLPIERARHIIKSIYQSLPPVHFSDISITDLTEGLCAVFSRILDEDPTQFDSDKFKLVLFILLNMNITLKYMYLYQMVCFPSATITLAQARILFNLLARVVVCLDNNGDIESTAESLVDGLADGKEIDKSVFLDFVNNRPIELEFMHSLHVLLQSASVRHEAQCDVCGTYPIVGLRFRCLCCFDYDLCTTCHLLGSFSKDHLPGHDVQQLTKQTTPCEDFKAIYDIIRRRFTKSKIIKGSNYKALTYTRNSNASFTDNTDTSLFQNTSQEIKSNHIYRPLSRSNKQFHSNELSFLSRKESDIESTKPQIQPKYDNLPGTLQQIVRSVEMTNIGDRYVNVSSTIITTQTHPSNWIPPSNIKRDNSLIIHPRRAWQLFSSRSNEPMAIYQNNDRSIKEQNELYGFLPESHSTMTNSYCQSHI